jgi:hypothetical protein
MVRQLDKQWDAIAEPAGEQGAGGELELDATAEAGPGAAIDAQETLLLMPLLSVLASGTGEVVAQRPQRVMLRPASRRAPKGIWTRPLALALFACLCLLVVAGALDGMRQYALIRAQTLDAVAHIHAAQALLASTQPDHPLDAATLRALDAELAAADQDAVLLSTELGSPSGAVSLARMLPGLSARLASAAVLASAVDSACQAGRALISGSLVVLELRADGFVDARGQLTARGRGSSLAADLIRQLQASVAQAAAQLDLAVARARGADFGVLPPSVASSDQRAGPPALFAAEPGLRARLAAPGGWQLLARAVLGAAPQDSLL